MFNTDKLGKSSLYLEAISKIKPELLGECWLVFW